MGIGFVRRESCPVCGEAASRIHFSCPMTASPVHRFLTSYYRGAIPEDLLEGAEYQIAECPGCALIYQTQILTDEGMGALYEEWIDADASLHKKSNASLDLFLDYALDLQAIGRLVPRPPHAVRVLEFGSGWGFWARMAASYGYQVTCVELSPRRANFARRHGLEVVPDINSLRSKFDVIYANQVFEHLSEPIQALRDLVSVLEPTGFVDIRVPRILGALRRLQRTNWEARHDALHPLEHINAYSRSSLSELANRCHLEPAAAPWLTDCTSWRRFARSQIRQMLNPWIGGQILLRHATAGHMSE